MAPRAGGLRVALCMALFLAACGGPISGPPGVPSVTPSAVADPAPGNDPATPTLPRPTPAFAAEPASAGGLPADLADDVDALIRTYARRGLTTAGIIIKDDETGEAVRINPDEQFPAASLYKLFVLWAVQGAIRAGELDDDTALTLTPETDDSVEDGYRLGEYGETVTVATARRLMITASNNTAAWLLVEALGGWWAIERPLRANKFALTETSPELLTTPREVTIFFEGLVNETLDPALTAADYALMRGLLRDQIFNDYLSPGLPAGAVFAHKTGVLDVALHDTGIVTLPSGRIIYLTVLTEGDRDTNLAFMRDLAELVTAAFAE